MKPWKVLFAVGCSLIVASCGGGGGGGTATININTFDIKTAYSKSVIDTNTYAFDFTALIGRNYATGSGTIEQTPLVADTWENNSVLSKTGTVSGIGLSGSQQVGIKGTTKAYYDLNYSLVGRSWVEKNSDAAYSLTSSKIAIPTSAKIGDSGLLVKENIFSPCRPWLSGRGVTCNAPHSWPEPDPIIGSYETTYRVEADANNTAILIVTATRKGTAGEVVSENTSSYRITSLGIPTLIELRTKEGSDESTLTITSSKAPPPTSILGVRNITKPKVLWTREYESQISKVPTSIVVDNNGYIYYSGSGFIRKLTPTGELVGELYPPVNARALNVDADGNVYFAGYASILGTNIGSSIFKFDSTGKTIWTASITSGSQDKVAGIAIDKVGAVYAVGTTSGILDSQTNNNNIGRIGQDGFLVKFDAGGNRLWIKQMGSSGFDTGNAVSIGADGAIYVTGSANYGSPFSNSINGQSIGLQDIYLAKFTPDGTLSWLKVVGTTSDESSESMIVTADGFIYIEGMVRELDFYGKQVSGGNRFVSKFDTAGQMIWFKSLAATDPDIRYQPNENGDRTKNSTMKIGSDGSIYVSSAARSSLLYKLNSDGTRDWATNIASTSEPSMSVVNTYIGASSKNGVYTVGTMYFQRNGNSVYTTIISCIEPTLN